MKRSSKNVQDPCHSAPVLSGNGSSNSNIHIIPHHVNIHSTFPPCFCQSLVALHHGPNPLTCGCVVSDSLMKDNSTGRWPVAIPGVLHCRTYLRCLKQNVDTSTQAVLNRGTQQEMTMTTTTTNKTTETTTTKRQQATTTQQPTTAEGPNPQATN